MSIPMTLASAISMLSAQPKLDVRGSEILAAAISLQKSTGRSLKEALHAMATSWGVQRQEKISGKWKNRSVATLQELLINAVCSAAAQYLAASPENTTPEQRGAAEHEPSDSSCTGAAEHVVPDVLSASTGRGSPAASTEASNATQGPAKKAKTVPVSWAQLEHRAVALPETAEDVMDLRRLGLDLFEATKRSGESWVGDSEVLRTLPRGTAKLATLEVQELMRARKAKTTQAQNVAGAASAGGKSTEPPAKKPRTLQEHFGREDIGAAEHVDRTAAAANLAHAGECATGAATAIAQDGAWLFRHGKANDHALLEWLWAQEAQPRCRSLRQQILAWGSNLNQVAMRKLVAAQKISVSHKSKATNELLLKAVRKHFREAISQEKGRLATLNLARRPLSPVGSGATEHAADAEQRIAAADVVDFATLKTYNDNTRTYPGSSKMPSTPWLEVHGSKLL